MPKTLHAKEINKPESPNQVEITISDRQNKIRFTNHIAEIESLFEKYTNVLITQISQNFMVIEIPEIKECNEDFGRFIKSVLLQLRSHYN